MATPKSRRRFLGLIGAGTSASLLLGAGSGRADEPKKDKAEKKPFQGTSKKGNFQEALDLAIAAAQKSAPGADRLVQWTLKEVSGRDGGIAGFREVTVTIEASIA
jgi:hypothetical protein